MELTPSKSKLKSGSPIKYVDFSWVSDEKCLSSKGFVFVLMYRFINTGSSKKHENWKTNWRLLTDILENKFIYKNEYMKQRDWCVSCFLGLPDPWL